MIKKELQQHTLTVEHDQNYENSKPYWLNMTKIMKTTNLTDWTWPKKLFSQQQQTLMLRLTEPWGQQK